MLRALIGIALIFGLLWILSGFAVADEADDKCRALRELNEQYRDKKLSPQEQVIKSQMVAWYRANCRRRGAKAQ